MPEVIEKPRKGGLMTPHPPEKWEEAKGYYLSGMPIAEIAKLTGLAVGSITGKAKLSGWTETKLKAKAKEDEAGEKVKGSFSKSLAVLASKLDNSNPKTLKAACAIQSMLVPAVQNAKTVFGWSDQQQNTLVNVQFLSEAVLVEPVQQSVIECESSIEPTEQSMLNPEPIEPEKKG